MYSMAKAASALHWCPEEIREHILEVDFEWDEFCDGFRWEDVIKGLKLYKTLYDELPDDDFKVGKRPRAHAHTHTWRGEVVGE